MTLTRQKKGIMNQEKSENLACHGTSHRAPKNLKT